MRAEILKRALRQQEYVPAGGAVTRPEPLVSVTLVTYNHAAFIAQSIESVLSQEATFPFELVIGEDQSTDGTREICQRYADAFPGVIRLFLRDRAESIVSIDGRDRIFNGHFTRLAARGRYVAPLEGDDYWTDPLKLARQVRVLEADRSLSACFTNADVITEGRPNKRQRHYPNVAADDVPTLEASTLTTNVVDAAELIMQRRILIMTWLLRREVFATAPDWFYDIPYCDRASAVLAAGRGGVRYLTETTAVYRRHPGGIWTGWQDVAAKSEVSAAIFHRINEHFGYKHDLQVRTSIARSYLAVAAHCAKRGLREDADRYAAKGCELLSPAALAG